MKLQSEIKLSSAAFENNQNIPNKYTCVGDNINPSLTISNIPASTKSLAIIVDDPDAPRGDWVHWLVWNIPANTEEIKENSLPIDAIQGLNDSNANQYDGPCPPSGTHRYFFKLYALDNLIDLGKNSRKKDLESAMIGHIIDQTELVGLFSK